MQIPSRRDGDSWGNALVDLHIKQYDHWAVISRHPRLARAFMSCPGLPTPASRRWFALGVGFRDIDLSGIVDSIMVAGRRFPLDPGLWHSLAFAAVRQEVFQDGCAACRAMDGRPDSGDVPVHLAAGPTD
jgi:hypothetical protein